MDQDADAPDVAAPGDEQVNLFHAASIGDRSYRMNGILMSIPTYEHIIEAVQKAARLYPGGIRGMASEMDMAPSSLGNILNPYADRSVVKLGLEQALFIMKTSEDISALRIMASEFGCSLSSATDEPDAPTFEAEALQDYPPLVAFHEGCKRFRDGELSAAELDEFKDKAVREIRETFTRTLRGDE